MLRARAASIGLELDAHEKAGLISLEAVDAAEVSPGQFAANLRNAIEQSDIRVVVIDSLNGYLNAMASEKHLALHLHELLAYAAVRGVAIFMILSQQGMLGTGMSQSVDASYLADTVLLFRYFEHAGDIRKAISVLKRRGGSHETSIRALAIGKPDGIKVGQPLHNFRGVLTGVPEFLGVSTKEG